MASTLRIDRRFRGPPSSGNGGYVAGLLARELDSSGCVVTLKAAPPLDQDLRVDHSPDGASLWAGDLLIAQATRGDLEIAVPEPPSLAEAANAEAGFSGFQDHVFPGCFVCGPERPPNDGLRIFPGSVRASESHCVAASWTPDFGLADDTGRVRSEFLWAALDCPGYFAIEAIAGAAVLGRIGVSLHSEAMAGDQLVVTGWPIESIGRKHVVGTALHTRERRLVAAAKATWISIDAADWQG